MSNTNSAKIFCKNSENANIYKHFFPSLLDINLREFHAPYVKCYINKAADLLYFTMSYHNERLDDILRQNPQFKFTVSIKGKSFYVFKFPSLLLNEVEKIVNGKLLTLARTTKEKICKFSGLDYNVKEGAFINSHIFLQALYEDSPIRKLIAEYISIDADLLSPEVLAALEDDSPIYMENWVEQ